MNAADAIVAVGIGIAFGFALERAGLGNARKLSAQFLLRDFTVVKVMFTAVVTAMLGVHWLGRLGIVDVSFLYVPDTYLAPQTAGGVLFGAGFALAGLCPGTSCVSAATGRGDGLATAAGLFAGVLVTGLVFAPLQSFYESGARGALTLPSVFGLPAGVVVLLVTAIALAVFGIAGRFENGGLPPEGGSDQRGFGGSHGIATWLAVLALALGLLAAADGIRSETQKPRAAIPVVRPHSGC
jgi:hypothetical protein